MIRREGFEQCEGKKAHHSRDYSGAPPRSCEGHSGHSGISHQPTSHWGCFECGDMGHFVRDCPRTRCGGLHQEVVLLLVEVVVVEDHNLRAVVLTIMFFRVGKK
ncbi:hypothetical protein H5410_031084, partial [Solanum commersonii]